MLLHLRDWHKPRNVFVNLAQVIRVENPGHNPPALRFYMADGSTVDALLTEAGLLTLLSGTRELLTCKL